MTISVVIPTHNRARELKRALRSVFAQTALPDEIVVVDDGSRPSLTADVFAGAPSSVATKLVVHPEPLGGNRARNSGIAAASGDWIAFLDDDDEFMPDKLEAVGQILAENPDASLVYHPAEITFVDEGIGYRTEPEAAGDDPAAFFRRMLVHNSVGGTSMVIARRSALVEAGLFDADLPALQDYEMWLRLARRGERFVLLDRALTRYYHETRKRRISKDPDARARAFALIETKYADAYADLNPAERRTYEIRKVKGLLLQAHLNGRRLDAFKLSMQGAVRFRSARFLASAVLALGGPSLAVRARAWLGRK